MVTHHKRSGMEPTAKHEAPTARSIALGALVRIERDGAYANLALPKILSRTQLSDRDTRFATELVYGTLRMRRACDFIVDRFITRDLDLLNGCPAHFRKRLVESDCSGGLPRLVHQHDTPFEISAP